MTTREQEIMRLENAELRATIAKFHRQLAELQIKLITKSAEASHWQAQFEIAKLDPTIRHADALVETSAAELTAIRETVTVALGANPGSTSHSLRAAGEHDAGAVG